MNHLHRIFASPEPLRDRIDLAPAVVMAQRTLPKPWEPPPIVPSELGNWMATPFAVVSDRPLAKVHDGAGGAEDVDYYSGYLICESLPSGPILAAITGLPRLARAAERACNGGMNGLRIILGDPVMNELADALVAAFPALLLPHRKFQTEQTTNGKSH